MSRAVLRCFEIAAFALALIGAQHASAQQVAAPYTHATRLNAAGQVTGTIAPDPDGSGLLGFKATRNTYGTSGATSGLLVKVESGELAAWESESVAPSAWSAFAVYLTKTFEYDDQARKTAERVIGSDGVTIESLTQYSYDDWGRVVCQVQRMNPALFASSATHPCILQAEGPYGPDRITRFGYDVHGQVLTQERAVGTPLAQNYVTNTYYGIGLLRSQRDANGNHTELDYDDRWRLERRYYPSATSTGSYNVSDYNGYGYDANGNVTYERKRNGQSTSYTYDNNNRLIYKNLSDNTYSGDVTYGYDLRGLTVYSCFGAHTTSSTSPCVTAGEGESNSFDGFGNLTSRVSRVGAVSRTLTYKNDAEGNRVRITHNDGQSFSYGLDGLNRVCSVSEGTSALACDSTSTPLRITYRPSGGRLDLLRKNGTTTSLNPDNALRLGNFTQNFAGTADDLTNSFLYNPASQIRTLSRSNELYSYTELGSRTGTWGKNGLNQITSIAGNAVAHDANGNLTADGAGMTFTYDMENHLVTTGGSVSSTLVYDVLGRLAQITVGGQTTQFHYDGDALVGEYVGTTLTGRYVHSGGVDEPWLQYNGASVGASHRRYLHADHQGSIIAHSDYLGSVTLKNAYDAYGIPKSTNAGRFGYTGQTVIPQLGLNYYKARFYAPRLGRFLQTDPIFYKDDMNLYAYVRNDPLNNFDPTGMACVPCAAPLWPAIAKTAAWVAGLLGIAAAAEEIVEGEGEEAGNPEPGTDESDEGVVYCCDGVSEGQRTPSGKPYVGTADNKEQRAKTANDGRERANAETVGTYPKGDQKARQEAEQKGMNDRGGKSNLDNKRNEIREDKWPERGIDPPKPQ